MECRPNGNTVFKNVTIAKKQPLPENQRRDRHIHRISHIAIETADDQVARWENWRRRTESFKRKAREGLQEDGKPCGHQQHAENPKRKNSGQRCCNLPVADQPGDVPRNGSRRNDQEDCGADDGEDSPHPREFYNAVRRAAAIRKLSPSNRG